MTHNIAGEYLVSLLSAINHTYTQVGGHAHTHSVHTRRHKAVQAAIRAACGLHNGEAINKLIT